jgi:hypothetical protein
MADYYANYDDDDNLEDMLLNGISEEESESEVSEEDKPAEKKMRKEALPDIKPDLAEETKEPAPTVERIVKERKPAKRLVKFSDET